MLAAARIKSAGAIIVGKTTTPECYHKVLTDSPLFGVTHNPWALDHTPGGSSGGAAAALAAGIAPLAVGTDGGGSIRCPAACTGILGLKPTLGRIPMEAAPDSFACYSFAGPMARNVRDLALLASVMEGNAGHDVHAQRTSREQLVYHEPADAVRGLRVGWIPRFRQFRVDTEVAAAAQAAVERLEADGSVVEILPDTTLDNVFDTYVVIATTAHAARFGGLIDQLGDRLTPSLRELILQGRSTQPSTCNAPPTGEPHCFDGCRTFLRVWISSLPRRSPPLPSDSMQAARSTRRSLPSGRVLSTHSI